ncbi:MAG: NUDIX domain-containing protein [Alistipes sp.]|nr:NUDIX domain-containing protein [Alistipes sp.]
MRTDIYFAHNLLILTDSPVNIEGCYRMPSSELSRANVLKIFETTNTIVVVDTMIEYYKESFISEFKYVEAAGGLVENEKGETLMIYCYRHWDLPKGHIDEGESAEVCAVREVAEETGVEGAKIVRFLCNTMHAYGVYGVWELKQTSWYLLSAQSCPTNPQKEEDIAIAKWCSPQEVEENLLSTYPTIRNVFAEKNR